MGYGAITEEQFLQALTRLGERDVLKLVRGGAFDGDEARWAAAWLRGERTVRRQASVHTLGREEPRAPVAVAASNPFASLFRPSPKAA